MLNIFTMFLQDLIMDVLGWVNLGLDQLAKIGLYMEKIFAINNNFTGLKTVVLGFGISLIVLKFLKKGFDTYVVWSDDAASDPMQLMTNFIKALVVALSFSVFYDWMYDILLEFDNKISTGITSDILLDLKTIITRQIEGKIMGNINAGTGNAIMLIMIAVFLILIIALYIQLVGRGFENFVLRVGMPIAAAGLIEQNKGVFAGYMNKLFQSTISVIVQIGLMKLALVLIANVNIITAIACLFAAMKTPKLLQEFMVAGGGGGLNLNTVYYTGQMARMIKSIGKKG